MRWTALTRGTHRCESDRSPASRRRVSCSAIASSTLRVARSGWDCAAFRSAASSRSVSHSNGRSARGLPPSRARASPDRVNRTRGAAPSGRPGSGCGSPRCPPSRRDTRRRRTFRHEGLLPTQCVTPTPRIAATGMSRSPSPASADTLLVTVEDAGRWNGPERSLLPAEGRDGGAASRMDGDHASDSDQLN